MKNQILLLFTVVFVHQIYAQNTVEITPKNPDAKRVITTGLPFVLIAADARAASMGDMGVATGVDAFSQQWNPSKYAFSETKQGIGVSYTPYLSSLVNDIFLGNVTYFNRIDERSAFAASFKYFSLGEIELVQDQFSQALIEQPNEMSIDASYSLKLSQEFAMSVAMRYMRSDLKIGAIDADAEAASTFGVDVSGYYQSEEQAYAGFNGRTRLGFAIQNIGPKFKYDDGGEENFQPTTLRLGGGFDFILDDFNKVSITGEVTKLLVPTPPVLGERLEYENNDGVAGYQPAADPNNPMPGEDVFVSKDDKYIVEGKDRNVGFFKGMFQSFGDAPDGFSEELQEWTWALGAEYMYQDSFAFRGGYFHESSSKGARQFFAIGAGFKYNVIGIDLSYLFSASKVKSPLENTLRFSLTFNLGPGTYREY
ncbi:type IX secretion system outer membrane channel protein PorV [Bizionia argentinensis JUB59]|uniref:Type IX secretion system outer membrane channel protein PorV n=1 Tax=Bizionia argentinensis JUB59 TaxID=1046627 RepID=G2EAD8_9FLAO|nr:type IX secretion system outer membrane channel protein PorV [Bizionia argentinensis]EGV44597.1 type IX secretion system outer membrane channel protein PorV [Bizionia argentinensis JUB59]